MRSHRRTLLHLCMLAAMIAALAGPAVVSQGAGTAPQEEQIALVGQLGGTTQTVVLQAGRAYVGIGQRVVIMDVANPAAPHVLGQSDLLGGTVSGIALAGQTAYVATLSAGLHILDVSNPALPVQLSSLMPSGDGELRAVALSGHYALVGGDMGLRVVDVADPRAPAQVSAPAGLCCVFGITVTGTRAYTAGGALATWDISNPGTPHLLSAYYAIPSLAYNVAVVGNLAYIAAGPSGFLVFNISDPAHPTQVGAYTASYADVRGVAVVGSLAYLAEMASSYDQHPGLRAVNVADPLHPASVGFAEIGSSANLAVAGGYAFVAGIERGLRVVSLGGGASPVEVASYVPPSAARQIGKVGQYLLVGDRTLQSGDLSIVNVSNPARPSLAGSYQESWFGCGLTIAGSTLYSADCLDSLHILSIADPVHPSALGLAHTADGGAADVAVSNGRAYVVGHPGMSIFSVTNPASPNLIATLPITSESSGVRVAGSYAYVVTRAGGSAGWQALSVIDVSNPAAPRTAGTLDVQAYSSRPAIAGHYAYLASADNRFLVVDIADPARPLLVGELPLPDEGMGVAISGTVAFVSAFSAGLRAIDVTDPTHPVELAHYNLPAFVPENTDQPGRAWSVAVDGPYVYVAADGGLYIFQYPAPASPTPTPTATFVPTPVGGWPDQVFFPVIVKP